jgi:hypothetical protein
MKPFPYLRFAAIAAIALSFCFSAHADQVIAGTGEGTPIDSGHHLGGPTTPGGLTEALGAEFVLTQAWNVTTIDALVGDNLSGDTGGTLNISILAGGDPNSLLSPVFSENLTLAGGLAPAWEGLNGLNLTLGPGTYWLEFSSPDLSFVGFAGHNALQTPGAFADYAYALDGGAFNPSDDYNFGTQIEGNRVPDSGNTALLILGGLLPLLALAIRRQARTA